MPGLLVHRVGPIGYILGEISSILLGIRRSLWKIEGEASVAVVP